MQEAESRELRISSYTNNTNEILLYPYDPQIYRRTVVKMRGF